MIQYEDVKANDIVRYWGAGFVFLQSGGYWNPYQLTDCNDVQVALRQASRIGSFGEPEKEVRMTKAQFFQQAMLHRPPLGVLVDSKGDVSCLSWAHADGRELAKAIRNHDILVTPIPTEAEVKKSDEVDAWHVRWIASVEALRDITRGAPRMPAKDIRRLPEYLEVVNAFNQAPEVQALARMHGGVDEGGEDRLALVCRYLNQPRSTLTAAIRQTSNTQKPAYISGYAWLRPQSIRGTAADLLLGTQKICTVRLDTGMPDLTQSTPLACAIARNLFELLA